MTVAGTAMSMAMSMVMPAVTVRVGMTVMMVVRMMIMRHGAKTKNRFDGSALLIAPHKTNTITAQSPTAMSSSVTGPPPTGKTMNCLPSAM